MQSAAAVPTAVPAPTKQPPAHHGEAMPAPLDEKKESPSADGYNPHEAMMHPQAMMNVIPPQQVYVNTAMLHHQMMGLETQFQAMGMNETPEHSNGGDDSEYLDNNGDGSNEEDPVKLFIGQVPKTMSEEDIFPTFDGFGPLKDVAIIRDKNTGLHRGCAFVTYWSSSDAERAQEALHDKFTFPGARRPAQVKPAEPSVPENKLFIGMLSRKAGEDEIRELFAPFGEIREIYMIRGADGASKCAAFLRYVTREAALNAIENLHNNIVMDGSARPLIVKFADNKAQRQQRQMRNVRRQEMLSAMGVAPGFPGYGPPPMAMHNGAPQYPIPPQYGPFGAGNPPPPHAHHPHAPPPFMYAPQFGPSPGFPFQPRPDTRPANPRPREGPAGANLFVYHLPHDLTDADLATAFNPFGNVVSAKVYVDKFTGESKGFGFVSYDSVIAAEAAIEQMNGFQIGNKRLKVQHKRVHNSNGMYHEPQMPMVPPEMPHEGGALAPVSNS
eukprot:Nitzschia sp. Nitz4//scaffold2_size372955//85058//86891//NITZ4_000383-RA/size372955-snap-gene-0.69-mRNA-1//-1//CDS//3329546656//4554//frame0